MAAMAGGCLIKLYELANLSSYKGETRHQRSPERLPLQQDSLREDSPEGVHMRLHLDKSLADGDEAGDVQYPPMRHPFGGSSPFLAKAASTTSSTLDALHLDITL